MTFVRAVSGENCFRMDSLPILIPNPALNGTDEATRRTPIDAFRPLSACAWNSARRPTCVDTTKQRRTTQENPLARLFDYGR